MVADRLSAADLEVLDQILADVPADDPGVDPLAPSAPAAGEGGGALDAVDSVLRRFTNAATLGGNEAVRRLQARLLGYEYQPPSDLGTVGNVATEAVGGVAGGAALGAAMAPLRAAKSLAPLFGRAPRVGRTLLGGAESGIMGGTREAMEGGDLGDIAGAAATEGALGLGMDTGMSAMGALYSRGVRLRPFGPKKAPKTGDPTLKDPLDPPTISEYDRMNRGLIALAERENIPVLVNAARPFDSFARWLSLKAAQSSAVAPYLMEVNQRIDEGFKDWAGRLVISMRSRAPVGQRETGVLLSDQFTNYVQKDLRAKASQIYEDMLNSGLGTSQVRGTELATQLRELLESSGMSDIKDPNVNKIHRLIARLEPTVTERKVIPPKGAMTDIEQVEMPREEIDRFIDFHGLWREGQKLYPSKKHGWDTGDFVAARANRLIKDYVKQAAEDVHPLNKALFDKADAYWRKAHDLEESRVGKAILSADPEQTVDQLGKNVTMLQETRRLMGGEFVTQVAQRKLATAFEDAIDQATGELSANRLNTVIKNLGGRHGNIDDEYLDELLRDHPDIKKAVKELQGFMHLYDEPRRAINPRYEQVGGGTETLSPAAALGSLDRALLLVLHFTTGRKFGPMFTAPPAENPFLGGLRPPLPESSTGPTLLRTLRRGAAATGTGQRLMGEEND